MSKLSSQQPIRKSRQKFPLFAQESFDGFRPFINIFGGGQWGDWLNARTGESKGCPLPSIDKETSALFRRHKAGETNLTYENGTPFQPSHFGMGIYTKYNTRDGILKREKHYYTSGRKLGILYNDVDAHQPWQTDQKRARELIDLVQDHVGMWLVSSGGENGYVKIKIDGEVEHYRLLCKEYQHLMSLWLWQHHVLCDYEIKGQPHTTTTYGLLAKLPFSSKEWNYTKLQEWNEKPIMSLDWLQGRIELMKRVIDLPKAQEWKKHIEQTYRKKPEVNVVPVEPTIVPAEQVPVQESRVVELGTNGASYARLSPGGKAPRLSTCPELGSIVDSFERQHQANLILARHLGRVPTIEEALDHIKTKNLYTGDWEENEGKREQRNIWSLKYIAKTYDPNKARKKKTTRRLAWSVQLENILPEFRHIARCTIDQAKAFIRSLLEYMVDNPENAWTWIAGRLGWFGIKANPAKVGRVLDLLQAEGIIELVQEWHVDGRRHGRHYQVLVAMENRVSPLASCLNLITTKWSDSDDHPVQIEVILTVTRGKDTS